MKNIVVIGGGNGIRPVIRSLVGNKHINLSAIVTTFDSGKSTEIFRKEFGIPAPGDLRRVLVDMRTPSRETETLATLFGYRFKSGKLKGINLGNLILLDLMSEAGSFSGGLKKAAELFNVKGEAIPVTLGNSQLVATFENGKKAVGEHLIDEPKLTKRNPNLQIKNITLKPMANGNPKAIRAINDADLLIFGPGDLYASVISNFLPVGMKQAIQKSRAKKIYILNLFTEPGETMNMTAADHAKAILKYSGVDKLDYVIVNRGEAKSKGLKKVVIDMPELKNLTKHVISEDLVDKHSPDRHSLNKISKVILSIL